MKYVIFISIACIILGIAAGVLTSPKLHTGEYIFIMHVVQPGETLWDIAKRHSSRGCDPRPIIYNIKIANGLDTAIIQPGDKLIVPIEEE